MNYFSALATGVIPNPTPTIPAEADGLLLVLNWASGIGLVLGVLGVIIVGIGMVIQLQRGEGAPPKAIRSPSPVSSLRPRWWSR
jgi:H+/gluconate symporter-like permease